MRTSRPIPMLDLVRQYEYMKKDIDAAIASCLSRQHWILGPEVAEFEERMAEYLGVKYCIGVASGTDALVIALRALAITRKGKEYFEPADEIITTPFTFVATGEAILRSGATPVFVDIDPRTLNIDPAEVESYLSVNPENVVGIIPVHLYGQSCDMEAILGISRRYGLFVLEDVAQALGGAWNGRKLGSMGDVAAHSFFPSKNLGCFGDGGMISTNDDGIAEVARMLRQHGGRDKYRAEHVGYNSRLDTLQAAVLTVKLPYLEEFLEKRRMIAAYYNRSLEGTPGIRLIECLDKTLPTYNQYTIWVEGERRDELARYLGGAGISTAVYYRTNLYEIEVFRGRSKAHGDLGRVSEASKKVLSLPIDPLMGMKDAERVVEAVKAWTD